MSDPKPALGWGHINLNVRDLETSIEFYAQLGKPGTSRAKALQHAQQILLTDPIQKHPAFWSPFLLISNWL